MNRPDAADAAEGRRQPSLASPSLAIISPAPPPDPWHEGVARLQYQPPLPGFSRERWVVLCFDCARLLDRWGDDMRRHGWSELDAFGVLARVPWRTDGMDLGLLINGGIVSELTASGATIATRGGSTLRLFRRPMPAGVVPVSVGARR